MSTVMMMMCDICGDMARPSAGNNSVPQGWQSLGEGNGKMHICEQCSADLEKLRKKRKVSDSESIEVSK
jgi:hypothetical protein